MCGLIALPVLEGLFDSACCGSVIAQFLFFVVVIYIDFITFSFVIELIVILTVA
jgi:hypothetical protein